MNYLFYIEGLNREVWQCGDSQKIAHSHIWDSLSDEDKNRVVQIECIDEDNNCRKDCNGTNKIYSARR
jgi:hypothetical protein